MVLQGICYLMALGVVGLAMYNQNMARRIEGWIESHFDPSFDRFEEWLRKEKTKR